MVPVMGPVPREVRNNWKAIRTRAHRILQLISKGQCVAEHQELLRTVMEAPESAPMTITDLVRLNDKIKMLSRRQLAHEEKKRHQDWREWIEETWTTSPGKVYQWIKEDKYTPTVLIQKEDGTLTGNVPEMDLVIHQKWDPIMRQHADPTLPEPETEPFWRRFGKYVEHHQMECQPITAERLCRQFKDMKRSRATGLDSWTVVDMRNMPWPLLHMLAQLLNWVESHGVWPEQLATGYIPLIPKGEGSEPLQLRPLPVLSAIYRAWSGIRLRDCLIWQEK